METQNVALSDITVHKTAIRSVNEESQDFIDLVRDLSNGAPNTLLQPITVRTEKDETTGEVSIILVDGLHRYTAATKLGWEYLPAIVHENMDRISAMSAQLRANARRIAQKPASEGKHYERMLVEDPNLPLEKLAELGGTTVETVKSRLKLAKNLCPEAHNLVDNKQISLRNAQTLAKVPESLQDAELLQSAQTLEPDDFHNHVTALKKEIAAGNNPKKTGPKEFVAIAKQRKRADLEAQLKSGEAAQSTYDEPELQAAFQAGIAYSLELDEDTVAAKREAFELKEAERVRAAAAKKQDIADKRAKEAAKAAEEAAAAAAE